MADIAVLLAYMILLTLVYGAIVSEVLPKSVAALLGGITAIIIGRVAGIFDVSEIVKFIDMKVLLIIIGIMMFVEVARRSGMFQFIALYIMKFVGYKPRRVLIILCVLSAMLSAFIGNITAMIIIISVTTLTLIPLGADPIPFLIAISIVLDLGGTITLIGSPVSILIGYSANFSYIDFLIYSAPLAMILVLVHILFFLTVFKKTIPPRFDVDPEILAELDPWMVITDRDLFYRSIAIFILTVVLFMTYEFLELSAEFVALTGGILMLFLGLRASDPKEVFKGIEWEVIFFLLGLFLLMGAIEKSGLLEVIAEQVVHLTGENLLLTIILIMGVACVLSAMIDNIPVTLMMIPIIKTIVTMSGLPATPLWWALLYGVILGGNLTPIASPTKIIALTVLEREGYKISFKEFMRYSIPTVLLSMAVAVPYLMKLAG
ncbi:MAG: SLC13 family permease [Candidatus Baldrarchaeia archaeon]